MYTHLQVFSFVTGWLSIFCWIIAIYPQVRLNIVLRQSKGLSLYFLSAWIAGDTLNTISTYILDQLFTQKLLNPLFMFFDLCLLVTHCYFNYGKKKYRPGNPRYSPLEVAVYIFVIVYVATNLIWAGIAGTYQLAMPQFSGQCPQAAQLDERSVRYVVGSVFSYLAIPCLVLSRPGQIHKNRVRRSTQGTSLGMFLTGFFGNLFQLMSLFTGGSGAQYYITKVPFALSTFVPFFCDGVILVQMCIYGRGQGQDTARELMFN